MSFDEAMAAKARAMFGKRLSEADYLALMQKKSVADIASALKQNDIFAKSLAGINEKAVHRGQLETLLRMNVYHRLKKLLRYSSTDYGHFIYAVVETEEIDLILSCIRWLMNQDVEARNAMIADMPIYIARYLSFDVKKLPDIQSFDELLTLLKTTRYEAIVARYKASAIEEMNYIGLEHELRVHYYDTVLEVVSAYKNVGEGMKQIVLARVELDNIALIYRLKKYFKVPSERIKKMMTHRYYLFTPKQIDELIEVCTSEEVIEKLQKKYKRYAHGIPFTTIEHYTGEIRYHMNRQYIETCTSPQLVLLSYLILSRLEIQNVIDIMEGVAYGIGVERMKALLVF